MGLREDWESLREHQGELVLVKGFLLREDYQNKLDHEVSYGHGRLVIPQTSRLTILLDPSINQNVVFQYRPKRWEHKGIEVINSRGNVLYRNDKWAEDWEKAILEEVEIMKTKKRHTYLTPKDVKILEAWLPDLFPDGI